MNAQGPNRKRGWAYVGVGFFVLLLMSAAQGNPLPILISPLLYFVYRYGASTSSPAPPNASRPESRDASTGNVEVQAGASAVPATVLGGSGTRLIKDQAVFIACVPGRIAISDAVTRTVFRLAFADLVNIEITGPGTEHTSAGAIGGGFGLEGALKGILVASAINKLTAKSKTNTFLRLSTRESEVLLHVTCMEPSQLRLALSPAIVQLEASKHRAALPANQDLSAEIQKLHRMHQDGMLTAEEFAIAKRRLLASP